ncbi:PREDICTED: uncharacterized protein LOC105556658 [Vollenhovia emeryi]|uniref:uncharacterized protein LOC105556658 n=1 Tax=Vollenhovia emeryi TaxID=411798 RepID=UPI0005F45605|nr:PREDICTED: uncharacterized protein LOC105556658 [Vollenhovia emeryi]
MSEVDPDAWVQALSLEGAQEQLRVRGLSTEGILPTLRARLVRYEKSLREGLEAIPTGVSAEILADLRAKLPPAETDPGDVLTGPGDGNRHSRSARFSAQDVYNVMRRWNLNFKGARGNDAEEFLVRLKEGRALVPVPDEELFKCLPFFLSGIALQWFRRNKAQFRAWSGFEAAWRSRFGATDFQYALREEIMKRTQGEQEAVADYLTCLAAMFDRLTPPWPLEEQLNHALRNMLSRVQLAIHREEVRDFRALEQLATRYERACLAAKHYRAPPTPENSLFPDLAYRPPKKNTRIAAAAAAVAPANGRKGSRASGSRSGVPPAGGTQGARSASSADAVAASHSSGKGKCWNCEKIGHLAREWERVNQASAPPGVSETACVDGRGRSLGGCAYGVFPVKGRPPLGYFHLSVNGLNLWALVDTGSNRTLLGWPGIEIVHRLGLRTRIDRTYGVRTANGELMESQGEVDVSIELEGRRRTLAVWLMPRLSVPAIVGVDFLHAFGILLNLADLRWSFADDPAVAFGFEGEEQAFRGRCGAAQDSTDEEAELAKFLSAQLPKAVTGLGVTTLTEHHIDVGQHPPIRQRCYLVSPKVQEAIREEVDAMLKTGVIEPSYSDWSNPIVMVKKANGKYRFCLDFRRVNAVSKKDAYPLPNMTGILDKMRAAKYISTLDLSQAYFQIPLAKDSREKTAFSVPGMGHYQFTRMPYGLTGAPGTFQHLLDKLIGPEMEPYAFAYLDDIVVATPTFEEHLSWLKVLDRITAAGLAINPEKCEFCRPQVKYLGFLVQRDGLTVDPEKTQPILEYPRPTNIKQLRRFLGMASWYRKFIPQFVSVTEPLTRLLKKSRRWEWEHDQDSAFEKIRSLLMSPPILARPDFTLPFVLQTDASSVGIGAVLAQTTDDVEHVIAYASRALTETERRS